MMARVCASQIVLACLKIDLRAFSTHSQGPPSIVIRHWVATASRPDVVGVVWHAAHVQKFFVGSCGMDNEAAAVLPTSLSSISSEAPHRLTMD
jgi:hypothetical protein